MPVRNISIRTINRESAKHEPNDGGGGGDFLVSNLVRYLLRKIRFLLKNENQIFF